MVLNFPSSPLNQRPGVAQKRVGNGTKKHPKIKILKMDDFDQKRWTYLVSTWLEDPFVLPSILPGPSRLPIIMGWECKIFVEFLRFQDLKN